MRILNVGDFNWMTGRERDTANVDLFAIRSKLSAAAIRAGHHVVEFSDRAVARNATPWRSRKAGRGAANAAFLRLVDEVRPDLILLNFADDLDAASLTEARKLSSGVKVVDINIDPLPDPKNVARFTRLRGVIDASFVTTAGEALAGIAGPGAFAAYMPNPVDPAVETGRAFEVASPSWDLVLPVGDDSLRQIGGDRLRPSQALAAVRQASPELTILSPGLEGPRLRGSAYINALSTSGMGWALSRHNDQPLYASDRMAHMLGCGLATLLDAGAGFDRIYADDEVGFYRDLDELTAKLAAFAADDDLRRETARRGWTRTWAVFGVERVFAYMLNQVFNDGGGVDVDWPAERW
ncbi:MAG: glycosyltransferase [Caulobacteraceae bacterium]